MVKKIECICNCGKKTSLYLSAYKRFKNGYICRNCANKKMSLFPEMIGKKFEMLTVIKEYGTNGNNILYECKCDCGSSAIYNGSHLRRGMIKRCKECKYNLHRNRGHGLKGKSIWVIWMGILARCTNPNNRAYKNYGGRGIKVCDRWLNFMNFYKDMGDRPEGLQIDRINNDGNYEPGNCRWVTPKQNCANRRSKDEIRNANKIRQI